jgi:hypothetical protein
VNSDILQIAPTFLSGAHKLHDVLTGVTLVCAFAGMMIVVVHALQEKQLTRIWPMFVRMGVAVALLATLPAWGDAINSAMSDLVSQLGWGDFPGGVAKSYQAAITKKWGSASVSGQANNQTANGAPMAGAGGVKLTHYGYEQPGDPNYDSKSAQGIGAFGFDDTAGSLLNINSSGVIAAALSPDVVQQYGLKPGQQFTVQTASGESLNLVYADNTSTNLTGRIDVYDPQGSFSLDGVQVATVAGGAVIEGSPSATAGGFNLLNPATWMSPIINGIVYLLSIAALVCMTIVTIAQQILYAIELAISPVFIGLWLIPGLSILATRYFTTLAAVLLWPLGWVVSDLVTSFLIDWAVNPTSNAGQTAVNVAGTVLSGGTLAIGYWVLLALWVIGSSFVAPAIVSGMIITGGSGISKVFGNTVGVGAYMAYTAAKNAGVGVVTSAMGSIASTVSPAASIVGRPNYARRPVAPPPPV